jgi:hypothetical protein
VITSNDIIQDIVLISQQLSKTPTKLDYQKHGKYSNNTVRRLFGSWSAVISTIFNIPPKIKSIKIKTRCIKCGTETTNPKFCSSSCSASYLNKLRVIGRKHKGNHCILCNAKITPRRKKCSDCKNFKIKIKSGFKHISEACISDVLTNDTQKYRRIRNHARVIAKANNLLIKCECCNYDKHVECAHITPIKHFSKDTLIKVVNDPKNLKGLCPNCHWEFDNL